MRLSSWCDRYEWTMVPSSPVLIAVLCMIVPLTALPCPAAGDCEDRASSHVGDDYLVLDDFSDGEPGSPPRNWHWRSKDDDREKPYYVREEGGYRHVAVVDTGLSVVLLRSAEWDPSQYPIMTWCWRAEILPEGGDERFTETNDSAAGVYVIFSKSWIGVPRQIKYLWSTTLPVGTISRREGFARPWFVVLESGPQRLGEWLQEGIDLEHDSRQILQRDLPHKMLAIGILTDANSTGSQAAAAYADFRVWRRDTFDPETDNYCSCRGAPPSGPPMSSVP